MLQSPPSRRRGLKWFRDILLRIGMRVASFSEAGIEILDHRAPRKSVTVASFSEAWIEILVSS